MKTEHPERKGLDFSCCSEIAEHTDFPLNRNNQSKRIVVGEEIMKEHRHSTTDGPNEPNIVSLCDQRYLLTNEPYKGISTF
jgi:hypothetical protein